MAEKEQQQQHLEAEKLEENHSLLEEQDDDDLLPQAIRSQRALRRPPRRFVEWLVWGILILFSLAVTADNIRLRRKQQQQGDAAAVVVPEPPGFKTDLSKSHSFIHSSIFSGRRGGIRVLSCLGLSCSNTDRGTSNHNSCCKAAGWTYRTRLHGRDPD